MKRSPEWLKEQFGEAAYADFIEHDLWKQRLFAAVAILAWLVMTGLVVWVGCGGKQ